MSLLMFLVLLLVAGCMAFAALICAPLIICLIGVRLPLLFIVCRCAHRSMTPSHCLQWRLVICRRFAPGHAPGQFSTRIRCAWGAPGSASCAIFARNMSHCDVWRGACASGILAPV